MSATISRRKKSVSVLLGTLMGAMCGVSTERLLANLIEGAKGPDLATYILAAVSICLVAVASIWIAARRIIRMDVVEILRAE